MTEKVQDEEMKRSVRGEAHPRARNASCNSSGCPKYCSKLPEKEYQPKNQHDAEGKRGSDELDSFLLIGKLAVRLGYITRRQLKEAIELQKKEGEKGTSRLLGEVFLRKGFMTQSQLNFLLSLQEMRKVRALDRKFGDMAVEQGLVSKDTVVRALNTQKKIFLKKKIITLLAQILVGRGHITQLQRDKLLLQQGRTQKVDRKAEAGGTNFR